MNIQLPEWTDGFVAGADSVFPTVEDRMRFVVDLSRQNIEQGTGGPFAAGVFDHEGRLIAPGVNMVVAANCSVLHAEIVALCIAQSVLGRYDIGDGGKRDFELVATTEPCAMCFGAIPWSGVSRLVYGARGDDARAIGFDEGPKLPNWIEELTSRGIAVLGDVLRDEAAAVLREYVNAGGPIYNAGDRRQPTTP